MYKQILEYNTQDNTEDPQWRPTAGSMSLTVDHMIIRAYWLSMFVAGKHCLDGIATWAVTRCSDTLLYIQYHPVQGILILPDPYVS